jgi:hypothetical protein
MMHLTEIPPSVIALIQLIGLPGLIFIIWYGNFLQSNRVEQKRNETRQEYMQLIDKILAQYRDDVTEVRRLYENNARLCDDWNGSSRRQEKIISDLMGVISLNSQAFSRLESSIKQHLGGL